MPDGLNPEDPGICLLGHEVAGLAPERLLLVHCGDIPGVAAGATRLVLDVREYEASVHRCVAVLPGGEALADGTEGQVRPDFDCALVWPRAHLGKDFSEQCLAEAAARVMPGGRILCAARKQKGSRSLAKTLARLVGEVEVLGRDRGYHLICGYRQETWDHEYARSLLGQRYVIEDPVLGDMRLHAVPGVFSRKGLDGGTRALLRVAECIREADEAIQPSRVLDLCAGVGPLGLWAAQTWPKCRVLAVDSNLRAVACLQENSRALGVHARVSVFARDGLPPSGFEDFLGNVDLALINPPTHADEETLRALLGPLPRWLGPDGRALLVINRPGVVLEILRESGAQVDGGERDGYLVLEARWP